MNVKIVRGAQVSRPTPDAITSSVLDHATVVTNDTFGMNNNEGLWPSYNCLDLLIPTSICPDPVAAAKQFSVAEWVPGFQFAVYGGTQCNLVGLDVNDQKAETERVFLRSEGKGIEQALLLNRFVANEAGSDDDFDPATGGHWDAPVDLGAAPTLLSAIGILEGYAAAHYAGLPTLHVPRAIITMGFGQGALVERDGKFYTKAGSKVAAGGGYDDPDGPQGGGMTLYVTGEVYVEQSSLVSVSQFVVPGDGSGTGSGDNGLSDNTSIALAERLYRVGVDCLLASVDATVWA